MTEYIWINSASGWLLKINLNEASKIIKRNTYRRHLCRPYRLLSKVARYSKINKNTKGTPDYVVEHSTYISPLIVATFNTDYITVSRNLLKRVDSPLLRNQQPCNIVSITIPASFIFENLPAEYLGKLSFVLIQWKQENLLLKSAILLGRLRKPSMQYNSEYPFNTQYILNTMSRQLQAAALLQLCRPQIRKSR